MMMQRSSDCACRQNLQCSTVEDVLLDEKYSLRNITLKAVTKVHGSFVIRHESENGTWYTGLCIDLLDYIAKDLNFSYIISEPSDRSWGSRLGNGTWIGMTGLLHRKEADVAVSAMSITADRASVSDYTSGFYFDDIVLMVSRPVAEVGWTFLLRPFHWLVYVVIGLCLLSVTFLYVCLERRGQMRKFWHGRWPGSITVSQERQKRREHFGKGIRARSPTPKLRGHVVSTLQTFYGALLGRAVEYGPAMSWAGHMLLSAWLLLSLVMVAVYTGKLTAISVVTAGTVPFSTLRDLVRQDTYKWGFVPGTMFDSLISSSSNEDYKACYEGTRRFAADVPTVLSKDFTKHVQKVLNEEYVFITTMSTYLKYRSQHCRLTVLPERLFADTYVIYLQKGSPYTQVFNRAIQKAEEFGLLSRWRRQWLEGASQCKSGDRRQVVSVSLHLLQSAFVLAAGGIALAALALAVEYYFLKQ